MLDNLRVKTKLWLMVALALFGVLVIQIYSLDQGHGQLLDSRENEIKHLVESASETINYFYQQRDEIGEEVAKAEAIKAIKALRYDAGKGYFWINDYDAVVVMHPIKPALDGKDMSSLKDPDGVRLFSEFAAVAKSVGEGVVRYKWEVPGEDEPVPKSSYVKAFKAWGWVLGTGVYINDIDSVFFQNARQSVILTVVVFALIVLLGNFIASNIAKPISIIVSSMKKIASGNLQVAMNKSLRKDEIGQLESSCHTMLLAYRELIEHGKAGANEITEAANMMAVVTEQSSAGVSRQYEETDALASAIEELASTIREVGENAGETATLTKETDQGVEDSTQKMKNTIDTINNLSSDVSSAGEVITQLDSDIKQIGGILDVIRNISEQTNLLALNAAIEAARAGESGRGFAVVADEVRSLAQRTQESTEEIQRMTEHLQSVARNAVGVMDAGKQHADSCVELAKLTGENLQRVAHQIGEVSNRNMQVASTVEQQGVVADEISRNIVTIRDVAQDTLDGAKILKESSEKLKRLTDDTQVRLSQYQL